MVCLILLLSFRQQTRSTERAATCGKTVANTVANGRTAMFWACVEESLHCPDDLTHYHDPSPEWNLSRMIDDT